MHSLLPPDHFVCRDMDDMDVPPPPPPRTTSIRCRPAAVSLVDLVPSPTCRSFRRSAPHPRHGHSSSSSSSSSNDTFPECLRRDFSAPEFRMRSLPSSSECVSSPAARSDCSTNSSGVAACPSLSSLSGGSPDTTKALIARSVSKPVKQPERQFVHSADSSTASVSSSDSSAASASLVRAQSVQCVSRAFERLSVASCAGTSSSSGTGAGSESSGETCGLSVSRTTRSESPPPPLPPKLFQSSRSAQSCSSLRIPDTGCVNKQQQVRTSGSKRKESDSRSRSRCSTSVNQSENHRPPDRLPAAGRNNASSSGRSGSDRRTCEKSGNRMIYLDALRRVKTSDTEIRAIQKRALMEFYFNCFKENTKNIHTHSLSPERTAPPANNIVASPAPVPNDCRPDLRPQPVLFQTAVPARVLAAGDETAAAIDREKQSSHKEAGVNGPKDDVCTKDLSDQMSELEIALRRKRTLLRDLKLNQVQSSELMSTLKNELSAYQIEKLSRCSEITVATQLVLSLRCRLKSLEKETDGQVILNNLHKHRHQDHCCSDKSISDESGISPDRSTDEALAHSSPSSPESSDANDDQDVVTRKRNKLQSQLDEAMSLKDMIALRSHRIRQEILSKSCSGRESEANHSMQYISLMYVRSELMTEISDVSEHISTLQQQASVTSDLT